MTFPPEIFAQVRDPGRPANAYPDGWVSDTTFAARVEHMPHGIEQVFQPGSRQAQGFEELLQAGRSGATERRDWRVPGRPRKPGQKCERCEGKGVLTCDLDEEHDCKDCRGKGELGGRVEAVDGQIVVDLSDGRELVLAGRFWPLFAHVHRLCALDEPFLGVPVVGILDTGGDLVAVVYPTRGITAVAPVAQAAGAVR